MVYKYRTRRWRAIAVTFSVIFIGGCFFLANGPGPGIQREKSSGLKFEGKHKFHNEEIEIEKCEVCHKTAKTADEPGMPDHAVCGTEDCHPDDMPESENPDCSICHEDPKGKVVREILPGFADVIISHAEHADVGVKCEKCHPGSNKWEPAGVIGMEDCQDCHKNRELTDATWNCAACHAVIREDYRPASHHKRYKYDHAEGSEGFAEGEDTRCMACHDEGDCNDCHEENPPRNHTNHFRQFGHGLHAAGDREYCAVCHRSDFCDACHRDARPRSHRRMSWSMGRIRHCIRCHEDIADSACQVCHTAGEAYAAHATAPPYPKDAVHGSVTGCSMACHRAAGKRVHVDTIQDCTDCHR